MSKTAERPPQLPIGFYISCPHCQDELKFSHRYVGLRTACRKCGGLFSFDMTESEARLVAVITHCPHCTEELRAIPSFMGKNVACNQCDGTFPLASRRLSFLASLVYRDEHASKNTPVPADSAKTNEEAPPTANSQTVEELKPDSEQPSEKKPHEGKPTETENSDSAIDDLFDDEASLFEEDPSPDDAVILGESSGLLGEKAFDDLVEEEIGDWYCKVLGQTMGPMSLDELRELARDKQIDRGDRVRCGETGEWQSPLTVASLLPDIELESLTPDRKSSPKESQTPSVSGSRFDDPLEPVTPPRPSASMSIYDNSSHSTNTAPGGASCAVAERKTDVMTVSTGAPERETHQPSAPARTLPSQSSPAPGPRSKTRNGATLRTDPVSTEKSNRLNGVSKPAVQKKKTAWETPKAGPTIFSKNGTIAVGVASVLVLVFGVWYFDLASPATVRHHRTLQSLGEEFSALREERVSSAKWAPFHRRVAKTVSRIVTDLVADGEPQDPAKLALLKAARDHMPKMMVDARTGVSPSEEAFYQELKTAEAHLDGSASAAR